MMTPEERLERVAEAEHDQWMRWAQTLMDTEDLSQDRIDRWMPFMVPYAELPDDVQEYDRIEARKAITAFIGDGGMYVHDREAGGSHIHPGCFVRSDRGA